MEKRSLFRQEALENHKPGWKGKALLTSKLPANIVVAISAGFLILLILFSIFGSYTRRINVVGEITSQPRAVNVFATQSGYVAKRFVNEGAQIKKGQPLFQIDVSRVTDSGKVSSTSRQAIENQLLQIDSIISKIQNNKNTTLATLQKQKEQYVAAYEQSLKLVEQAHKGMEAMRRSMNDYSDYQRKGLIVKDQLNNQRYLFFQQQNSYQSLKTQNIQEGLQIATLSSEIATRGADFDNQISQYEYQRNDLLRLLSETDASGSLVVVAPVDGKVESLSVTEGQMVNPRDSLAQLLPGDASDYYLVLWLPNASVPYVAQGDRINIRYDAFPYQKFGQFGGRVHSISTLPASLQEMSTYSSAPANMQNAQADSWYKVLIKPDAISFKYEGKELFLTSGMKAQSTLFLEKRPLYQWMFSPFYDMKKSVAGPISE